MNIHATKLLVILVSITLVLSIVNLFATVNLYGKTNSNENRYAGTSSVLLEEPSLGSANAPVTIVDFSDFQCPYCARFAQQTLPSIYENYIKTGKVKLIFKNFPLDFHKYAQKAAEASECANEQGKFWNYHDKLFENQNSLSVDNLKKYASDIGLDTSKFNSCVDSGKMTAEVQEDINDGASNGVSGTPHFLVNEGSISGACPFSTFEQAIKAELENKNWAVKDCQFTIT